LILAGAMLASISLPAGAAEGDDPPHYVKKKTWQETMLASRELLGKQRNEAGRGASLPNLGKSDFSVTAWIQTGEAGGTIVASAPAAGEWAPQGKVLFLQGGALTFDVGWVGAVGSDQAVNDGRWHHVALVGRNPLEFYVDGALVKRGSLDLQADPKEHIIKLGFCAPNFPRPSGFRGLLDEVRIYSRRLSREEIGRIMNGTESGGRGPVGFWKFEKGAEDSSGNGNHGTLRGASSVEGKSGKALRFDGGSAVLLPPSASDAARNELWDLLARDFPEARKEMLKERRDRIWDGEGDLAELAGRYAAACSDEEQRARAARLAGGVKGEGDLWKVRTLYHTEPPPRLPEAIPLDRDPHLAGFWRFDQETGKTAMDSSGNRRNGKLVGGLSFDGDRVRGKFGWALKYDGREGFVEIPGYKGISGNRPRTVAAWIKTKTARGEIVTWGEDDFGKMWNFGFVRGRVGLEPKGGYLYVKDALNDDAWHHVAVVMEEADPPNLYDNVKLYQDGGPATIHDIGLLDLWPLITGEDRDLRIGIGFQGIIDEVRIYDRALSEDEIIEIFNVKGKSR